MVIVFAHMEKETELNSIINQNKNFDVAIK